jgi:uncharacterized protein YcfL
MKQITLFFLAATLLFSCSKDKQTVDPPDNNISTADTTRIDQSKMLGEWHCISAYNLIYNNQGVLIDANGPSKTYQGYDVFWYDAIEAKFTFNNDNSFDNVRADGQAGETLFGPFMPQLGEWQLTNDNKTLRLTYDGFSSDGLENFDVVSFKDNYMHLVLTAPGPTTYKMQVEFVR